MQAASERGFTLFEALLILVATVAIVAALAPTLGATIADARTTRATTDMELIRDAILAAQADCCQRFTKTGTVNFADRIYFLYGDGDIPEAGSTSSWQNTTADDVNDFLEEHLVWNSFNGGNSWVLLGANAWRGAYINAPVDPDPWGNRYAVNVQYLSTGAGGTNDVVVFSAGPDEQEDTSDTGDPLVAGGDDIIVLVEA